MIICNQTSKYSEENEMRARINRANVISFSWHCFSSFSMLCFFFFFLCCVCAGRHTFKTRVCFNHSITTDNELITIVKYFRDLCVQ